MKLSIVSTLYKSAPYITEFHKRASAVAKEFAGDDYEIVFVNDGSPDNSLDLTVHLTENDNHLVVVDLSRNFGHHKAMMTGLAHAKGDLILLIDCDLEEEPEWLLNFSRLLNTEKADVVYGIQSKRKGHLFERISGAIFYRLFRMMTGLQQPNNITTARLMSRRYVNSLLLYQERNLNIGGLYILTGFKQCQLSIKKHFTSPTTYSFTHKISHLVNAITSFSSLPLVFIFYSGFFISISALIYLSYLAFIYLYVSSPPSGYTSIIASIWLFSGLIIFFIGILGIYISKVFIEVKQRPSTIIKEVYKNNDIRISE